MWHSQEDNFMGSDQGFITKMCSNIMHSKHQLGHQLNCPYICFPKKFQHKQIWWQSLSHQALFLSTRSVWSMNQLQKSHKPSRMTQNSVTVQGWFWACTQPMRDVVTKVTTSLIGRAQTWNQPWCGSKNVDSRVIFSLSLIHGTSWSLDKRRPCDRQLPFPSSLAS